MPRCNLNIVAGLKRSFAIAIKGRSCQECLRHEIVKFFFFIRRAKWHTFFSPEGRPTRSSATICVSPGNVQPCTCFSFAWSRKKKKREEKGEKSYG